MDLLECAKLINLKIKELDKHKQDLEVLAIAKARTSADYDMVLAKTILRLRSEDMPISIAEKVAKGDCYELRFEMDIAESKYKNILKIIDITQSQLMGYQSINKFLSEV